MRKILWRRRAATFKLVIEIGAARARRDDVTSVIEQSQPRRRINFDSNGTFGRAARPRRRQAARRPPGIVNTADIISHGLFS